MKAPVVVSLAQCDSLLGSVAANLEASLCVISEATQARSQLVVFPELSLTGYSLRDLTPDVALREKDDRLDPILRASDSIDIVLGWIEESAEHAFYNVAGYFSKGRLLHKHRKVYPVDYGMFDERRDWAAGEMLAAFDTTWGRVGLLICEDLWHPATSYVLFCDRADVIITLSASPARGVSASAPTESGRLGSVRDWDKLLQHQSAAFNVYSVYVNRVGVEDGTSFAGHSSVTNPFGETVTQLAMDPEIAHVLLDPSVLRRRRAALPMLRDERLEVTLKNLQRVDQSRFGIL
ncbi:MAG: nitrilase-related carbon-nitrogen hydrolase [Planctomycetota bacterium]